MTPTLDSIIKILPHDAMCGSRYQVGEGLVIGGKPAPHMGECNCPRRDQVAYLERLKEPTEAMLSFFAGTEFRRLNQGKQKAEVTAYRAMLKAAEETHDE